MSALRPHRVSWTVEHIRHRRKEVKKMKKITMIAVVVAVGLFVGAALALSWGPGFGPFGGMAGPPFGQGFGPPWAAPGSGAGEGFGPPFGLGAIPDLTAEQSAQMEALQKGFLEEIEPLREALLQKITELRSLTASGKTDQAKVSSLQKEILTLQGQLREKGAEFGLEMQQILTPDQKARLSAYGPGPGMARAMRGRMWR
jgi:Spy/CpxP family protein refolding chaperone